MENSNQDSSLDQNNLSNNESSENTKRKDEKEETYEITDGNIEKTLVSECEKLKVSEPVPETQVGESEEESSETGEDEEQVETPRPRGMRRARKLVPTKEEDNKSAVPSNYIDAPDYGYVGIDGSFQAPFS